MHEVVCRFSFVWNSTFTVCFQIDLERQRLDVSVTAICFMFHLGCLLILYRLVNSDHIESLAILGQVYNEK